MIVSAMEENKQTSKLTKDTAECRSLMVLLAAAPGQCLPAALLAQRGVRPCGCRLDGWSSSEFRVSCSIIDSAAALLFSSAFERWTM